MKRILNRYIYSEEDELGKGTFGCVYKGSDTKTKQFVAIKFMKIDDWYSEMTINDFKREMSIMKEFNHPNIVKLIDYQVNAKQNIVVFDFCDGGDLSKYLEQNGHMVDEKIATQILIQLMNGFQEIISKGYIHRDVKPANILIKDGIFKIADFGFATKATSTDVFDQMVGTPLYMAPQILENTKYSSKCDIWSIGIIAYELIYGRQPWPCRDTNSYLKNIKCSPVRFHIEKTISDQYKDFVRKCLKMNENERISWEALFKHPLLETRQLVHKTFNVIQLDEETKIILRNIQYIAQIRQLKLEEQFQMYDKDRGGYLDFNEFSQFLQRLDPSITNLEKRKIFDYIDLDRQQLVDIKEFQVLFCGNDFSDLKNQAERLIQDLKQIIISNKLDLDKLFNHFDVDKEDDLKLDEFTNLIQAIAPLLKLKEISLIFAEFDKDNDNSINRQEFKNALFAQEPSYEKSKLQKLQNQLTTALKQSKQYNETIFKTYNISRTNKLSFEEFIKLCKDYQSVMTEDEIKLIFKAADRNRDNLISFDEFIKFFK